MSTQSLKDDLRGGREPYLPQRRSVAALAITASAAMGVIALYQLGVLRRLPGPKTKLLDADKVNGSLEAYSLLRTPDAVLGLGSYAATAVLASIGPANRYKKMPLIPLTLGAKSVFDAAYAGKLSFSQWTRFRAFSVWSLAAAGCTIASLRFTLPEAAAAIKTLRNS